MYFCLIDYAKALTAWITVNWEILKVRGISERLTCLMRNLNSGQEATVRTGHGTTVQFSRSVMSDSLRTHGLQHARPPCPSPTPRVYSLMSIELVMPPNHLILCRPLLLLSSIFPASGSFVMRQFFTSGGQSIGVSASTSILPMNIQD